MRRSRAKRDAMSGKPPPRLDRDVNESAGIRSVDLPDAIGYSCLY
jgi:hypothetical protein